MIKGLHFFAKGHQMNMIKNVKFLQLVDDMNHEFSLPKLTRFFIDLASSIS